jgi:hypothetical protein
VAGDDVALIAASFLESLHAPHDRLFVLGGSERNEIAKRSLIHNH